MQEKSNRQTDSKSEEPVIIAEIKEDDDNLVKVIVFSQLILEFRVLREEITRLCRCFAVAGLVFNLIALCSLTFSALRSRTAL